MKRAHPEQFIRFSGQLPKALAWALALIVSPALASGAHAQGPLPRADQVSVPAGEKVVFDVLANDEHPAGLPLRVLPVAPPGAGDALARLRNGMFSFDAASGPPLPFAFTYTVQDTAGRSASAQVTLVEGGGVYTAPSRFINLAVLPIDETSLEIRWTYAGGDAELYRLFRGPNAGSLFLLDSIPPGGGDPDETIYTDGGLSTGQPYCYQVIVDRASGPLSSDPVCAVPLPGGGGGGGEGPVAVTDFAFIPQGAFHYFYPLTQLLANDTGDGIEWVPIDPLGISTDAGGTLTPINADQTRLLYVPPAGEPAADGFDYTIRDAAGREAAGRVEIAFLPRGGPVAQLQVQCSESSAACTFDAGESELGNGVKLKALTAGAASARLRWDFGDGTCIEANSVACPGVPAIRETHTYLETDRSYTATVTVFDWDAPPGQTEASASRIVVPGQPQFAADFTVDCGPGPEWICRLDSAPSILPAGGTASYQWRLWYDNFHFQELGTAPVIEQSLCGIQGLPCPGTFTVQLLLTYSVPGAPPLIGIVLRSFRVQDLPPTAAIEVQCDTETLACILDSGASTDDHGIVEVAWEALSPAGWIPAGAASDPVFHTVFPAAGFYTARLTVTDAAGQSAQKDRIFRVPRLVQPPVAHLLAGCFAGDLGGNVSCELRAGGSYGGAGAELAYAFLLAPAQPGIEHIPTLCSFSASPVCAFDPASILTISRATVLVQDGATWERVTAERLLLPPGIGNEAPQARFTAECDTAGAQPACTFYGTASYDREDGSAGLAYAWTLNGAPAGAAPVSFQLLPADGEYDLALTVTDSSGQQDTYRRPLCIGCGLDHPPTARAAPAPCAGSGCHLDGTLSSDDEGIVEYRWQLRMEGDDDGDQTLVLHGPRFEHLELPSGTWDVALTVVDGNGQTDSWWYQLTVNAAPVTVPDTATTPAATAVTVKPLVNDSDPDGDPLTLVALTPPSHGAVAISLGGQGRFKVRYTPQAGFVGVERLTYTASDGFNLVDGTIDITVEAQ